MADFTDKTIKTIGIFGGDGSGKTTLVDALMYTAGSNSRQGSVDQGTSISDTDEEEKARKGSIRNSPLRCSFAGKEIFLVDTPGYADFWGEVILAMEVVDSALIVVDGLGGADVTTRRVWDLARSKNIPVGIFINKLDKEHSSFGKALEGVESSLGESVIPLTLPDADHPEFSAAYSIYDQENISKITIPAAAQIDDFKEKLIEAAAETDDSLIEKYLESGTLDPEEVNAGLKKAFSQSGFTPLFSGSALNCRGVEELLRAFTEFFPSPQDRGPIAVGDETVEPNASDPLCARVFKSVHDPFVGQLSYLRIWAGTLKPESEVYNAASDAKERIGRIYLIMGKEQIDVAAAVPGCIVALAKLKETGIGDTLCAAGKNYLFPEIEFPSPTSLMAVYSQSRGDEDKIAEGFHKLIEEDPTLSADRDPPSMCLTGAMTLKPSS